MKVIKQEAIVYRMIFCDYKSNELIDFCNVMTFPVWRGNDKNMVYDEGKLWKRCMISSNRQNPV